MAYEQMDESYAGDPLLSLMAARGELTDDDVDEVHAMYDAGNHVRHTEASRDSLDNRNMAGAAPYEMSSQ